MKQKVLLVLLFVLALVVASCDSLWSVKETTDIIFEVSKSALEELFESDSVQQVSPVSSGSSSVLRSINFGENGIVMTVTIHHDSSDNEIASKKLVVKKDETMHFGNLAIVGKRVYAKIVLTQGGIKKEGRSESKKMVQGGNYLNIGNFINIFIKPEDDTIDVAGDMILKGIQGGVYTFQGADGALLNPVQNTEVASFYLGQTEVTQEQWVDVMGEWPETIPSAQYGVGSDRPAYYVSWYDAITFCNKLSLREGLEPVYSVIGVNFEIITADIIPDSENETWDATVYDETKNGYRLPTEVEWEYAAGGGAKNRTIYAGTNDVNELVNYAWYAENSDSGGYVTEVVGTAGSPTPSISKSGNTNALGLYDMNGNVREWCYDTYFRNTFHRAYRGGARNDSEDAMRVVYRSTGLALASRRGWETGFRIARSVN